MKTTTSTLITKQMTLPRLSLLALGILGLTACGGNAGSRGAMGEMGNTGETGAQGNDGSVGFAQTNFLRANNGSDNAGSLDTINQNAAVYKTFTTGANEGLELDKAGNLYQAADLTDSSIRMVCGINQRMQNGMYSSAYDRELLGSNTGLANPKGIAIAHEAGYLFVANFNGTQISVFGSAAAGDVAPVAVTTLAVKPWDLVYDEANDRLFIALVDGTIAVYDDYQANGFTASSADRIITPSDSTSTKISVNTHGIVYDAAGDRLVVSDVGSAADATDGAIFVISNASTADGAVTVDRSIAGPASMLGNPVDIVLTGTDLRVAEKSNDAILVFSNIFSGASGDIAPDLVTASTKPESLVEIKASAMQPDVSDTISPALIRGVAASSNSVEVTRFTSTLSAETASFDGIATIESVTFDLMGDAYATFGDGTNGGIAIANRVATSRNGETYTDARDRQITGASTQLVDPKGLDVDTENGLIFVADFGVASSAVLVYSTCASGDATPLLSLQAAGAIKPWDVDYDNESDTAYVALTNGTVAVFENVTQQMMAGTTEITAETRLITPAISGVAVSAPTNLHGIDFDPVSDSLLVSDVGSAGDGTDGKLYVLPAASSASGLTDITVNIAGPSSNLGNPVDVMFDGSNLYVAEKSNSLIMRFDNVLQSAGGDIAPTWSISYSAAESVALIPNYLAK